MLGSDSKYVVGMIRSQYGPHLGVLILPGHVTHSDIKNAFVEGSIESAGFFSLGIKDGVLKARAYGESVSLTVRSQPERDSFLINQALGFEKLGSVAYAE